VIAWRNAKKRYAQWVNGGLNQIEELKFSEVNYLGNEEFAD